MPVIYILSKSDLVLLINTGRGGLPPNPYEPLDSNNLFVDVQLPTKWMESSAANSSVSPSKTEPILEANKWVVNEKGHVELVSDKSSTISIYGDIDDIDAN